jgi:two-component system, OmpR family, response regulator
MAVILVVEDEVNICEVIVEILGQLGHEARVAGTAAEAVRLMREERPDAILLDIVLPDGRGTTVLDRLRRLRPDVPVVMVTANADEDIARETLKRGAVDYVMKPFDMGRLRTVLAAALLS